MWLLIVIILLFYFILQDRILRNKATENMPNPTITITESPRNKLTPEAKKISDESLTVVHNITTEKITAPPTEQVSEEIKEQIKEQVVETHVEQADKEIKEQVVETPVEQADKEIKEESNKIVIKCKGVEYDVTKFVNYHPGGVHVLVDNNGKEISGLMEEFGHSAKAYRMLEKYKI